MRLGARVICTIVIDYVPHRLADKLAAVRMRCTTQTKLTLPSGQKFGSCRARASHGIRPARPWSPRSPLRKLRPKLPVVGRLRVCVKSWPRSLRPSWARRAKRPAAGTKRPAAGTFEFFRGRPLVLYLQRDVSSSVPLQVQNELNY